MNRLLLTAGLLLSITGVLYAQDQQSSATANSQQQSTTSSPAADRPEGTVVKDKEVDTIVQPKNAPIEVNSTVISDAQRALTTKGYDAGPVDGKMGPLTRAAIQKFQADQNLDQTGRLDQKTLAALNVGGVQAIKAAPADLGRGGKAIGHNVVGGHPVEAGKAAVTGGKNFGKKVGQGAESTAVKVKNKTGSTLSSIGEKISGAGEETKKAGEATERKAEDATDKPNDAPPPPQR
ncbi:MAG TPA: peptidoglycan-binding domain-containing protein [Terriglobales bacterium]|nr:peptidoglycan-binding domain-containing protein [Terriglobales bacterium]